MASGVEIFDAPRVKFSQGANLIEASAGTGKTYAIGMLVLRGVVELGIPIEKILIVTFTKAATEELKARIRLRLAEARNCLQRLVENPNASLEVDDTLRIWLGTIHDRQKAIERLQLALYDIDSANIFTIHGFCQRMLVDQALESGQLFHLELVTSIDHIITELAEDFWREEIYSLDPFTCGIIISYFPAPAHLLDSVSEAFRQVSEVEPSPGPLDDAIEQCKSSMEQLRDWWESNSAELKYQYAAGVEGKYFKKGFCENFIVWFEEVSAFISGDSFLMPQNLELLTYDGALTELNGNKLRGDKKQQYLKEWNLPTTQVEQFLHRVDVLLITLRGKLVQKRDIVKERLLQNGVLGFNGLIENLAEALEGERAKSLAATIGSQYQLVLIDEFQDTDSLQYKIFSTLFAQGKHFLYLIGDPKQAIYKFRGADIYSYFSAKQAALKRLTLERNYRSHPDLLQEVNRLFSGRKKPFLYEESVLGYQPVKPGLSESAFDIKSGQTSLAEMVYCNLPKNSEDNTGKWTSSSAAECFCHFTVQEVLHLLSAESQTVYISDKGQRALEPKDIAILVRSNKNAALYQEKLIEAGIPAVVRGKNSVFHTDECLDLIVFLRAVIRPTDINRLKAAMAIHWFNLSGNELHNIWQNEESLSNWRASITKYNKKWLEDGIFSMLSSCIVDEEILLGIAEKNGAERVIVNIYHLVELLQEQESTENYGPGQLLGWLQNMYLQPGEEGGSELLLESDEDAVQIVTMHGAKGLEYPVVFCPYLWYSASYLDREKYQVVVHEEGINLLDIGSGLFEERKQRAEYDGRAEELRLLYVALTRAKVRCYCMWADVKRYGAVRSSFDSPLGYLLFEGPVGWQEQQDSLQKLAKSKSVSYRKVDFIDSTEGYLKEDFSGDLRPRTPSSRSLSTNWQMTSFSGLAALSDYEYEARKEIATAESGSSIAIPGLPAGASFGNVIHDLLEEGDFSSFSVTEETLVEIEKKCQRYGVSAEAEDIARLIEIVLTAGLPPGFSLKDIHPDACLKEMPFYFHLEPFQTGTIQKILHSDPAVLAVTDKEVRGYLTGFVDLICFVKDKYYVLDYKTNYLGDDLSLYSGENLVKAMRSHNYGLQYWIYSLVLHHHLSNLVEGYDYATHFGGVMYLFVRGMSRGENSDGVYFTRPDFEILEQLSSLFGAGENE